MKDYSAQGQIGYKNTRIHAHFVKTDAKYIYIGKVYL